MWKFYILIIITGACLAITDIGVKCIFKVLNAGVYTCVVVNLKSLVGDELVTSVSGKAVGEKTVYDIEGVIADRSNNEMTHLPSGFGQTFPNLQAFRATNVEIKYIKQENFANMRNLSLLNLCANKILTLPENVFMDLPQLDFLSIHTNKIRELPESLLAHSPQLIIFYFGANLVENLPEKLFASNHGLEEFYMRSGKLKTIDVDFRKFPNLTEVRFEGNKCTDSFYSSNKNSSMAAFMMTLELTCRKVAKDGIKIVWLSRALFLHHQ